MLFIDAELQWTDTGVGSHSLLQGIFPTLQEAGTATFSSVLGWRIPRTEEPGGLHSVGLLRLGHD